MASRRLNPKKHDTSSSNNSNNNNNNDNKKELRQEESRIGLFTLMFVDSDMERIWTRQHLPRHIAITTRYLFAASVFQGLFYWSDLLELDHDDSIHNIGLIRFALGGIPLLCCFLVATGLMVPTQMMIMWCNVLYGIPSLALFYWGRTKPSHWDSLFMIYGMCFFMLPKMSPLNFIYGFAGASMFSILYMYISSFNLSFQQWLLSSTFLLVVVTLFSYISYSSERVSRERWILRQRLQRERINLRIVASSIQDDMKRANEEVLFPIYGNQTDTQEKTLKLLSTKGGGVQHDKSGKNIEEYKDHDHMSASDIKSIQEKRIVLFFKGLAAWALCYGMGYTFDLVSSKSQAIIKINESEINSSAAFALLMHSMGFSVFLMYFTGQIRWLALNGVLGLTMLWIFNRSGMDNRWVVFSTHSVGYVLLAVVVIVMILVFGGVVLVWSHLIDFLKDVLIRYPEVKDGLSENKLLEQVLIRYISDIPKINSKLKSPHILEVYKDNNEYDNAGDAIYDSESRTTITVQPNSNNNSSKFKAKKSNSAKSTESTALTCKILEPRKPNCCFFCLKENQHFLIPACVGWSQVPKENVEGQEEGQNVKVINICTPYTEMAKMRDEMNKAASDALSEAQLIKEVNARLEVKAAEAISFASRLQARVNELETASIRAQVSNEAQLAAERRQREIDVQTIIAEHNHQLTELKRLFKAKMKKNTSNFSSPIVNMNKSANTLTSQKSHSTGDIEAPKNSQKIIKVKSQSQPSIKVPDVAFVTKKNNNNNSNNVQPVLDYFHGQSASDSSFQSVDTNDSNPMGDKFNHEDNSMNVNDAHDDRLWLSSTEYDEIEKLLYSALHNPFYLSYDDAVLSPTTSSTSLNPTNNISINSDQWGHHQHHNLHTEYNIWTNENQ